MDKRASIVIVAVFGMAILFVLPIIVMDRVDDTSMPLISTVLGFGTLILVQLLQGQKVNTVDSKVDKVLNGTMDEKIARVVGGLLDERGLGNGSVTGDDTTMHSDRDTLES